MTSGPYDLAAGWYEQRFADELARKPTDRALLSDFAAAVGDPVVDLGCGPGQIGAFVRAAGRRVIGLDLSPEMARLAAGRLDGAVVADLRRLPCKDASVGGVVAFYSVIHVGREQLRATLTDLRRVLRPGGQLLLSAHEGSGTLRVEDWQDTGQPFTATLYSLDELTSAAETAGLAVRSATRRPPYPDEGATTRLYLLAAAP